MKTLVVYYSLEGNTRRVAELISKKMKAELIEIEPVKSISKKGFSKYIWGGKQVTMREKPPIKELNIDLNNYDTIIIGTPVWAVTYAPAIRTFLSKYEIENKDIVLFCTHEGGPGKTLQNMKKELKNNKFVAEHDFSNVAKTDEESLNTSVNDFIKNIK